MNRLLFSLLLLPISGSGHGIEIDSSALRPLAPITVTFAPIESTVRPVPAPKPPVTTSAGNPKHAPLDRRQHRSREGWERIIPTHVKVQYAGGMGFLSFGAGWDYGRKCQWETDLYLGFLPRSKAGKFYLTATLKQNHIPWDIACGKRFSFTPFYYGLYINTIFGEKFWVREPERDPRKLDAEFADGSFFLSAVEQAAADQLFAAGGDIKIIACAAGIVRCDLKHAVSFGNPDGQRKNFLFPRDEKRLKGNRSALPCGQNGFYLIHGTVLPC